MVRVRQGPAVAVWSLGAGGDGGVAWGGSLTSQGRSVLLPGSAWPGTLCPWSRRVEPSAGALCRCRVAVGLARLAGPTQQEGLPGAEGRPGPGARVLGALACQAAGSVLGSPPPPAAFGSVAAAARVPPGPRRAATWGSGTRRRLRRETSTS